MIRLAVRVRRREMLSQMLLLSVALHLAFFLSFLLFPSTELSTAASGAPAVEVVADEGTPEGETLPTPSYAEASAVPTEAVPTPPVPQPEPPPPPAPIESTEVAALPPPPPPPAPAPPQQAAARLAPRPATARVNSKGAPPHSTGGQDASALANGANNGNGGWVGKLKNWWDAHSFYPPEASQLDEGGSVKVHITIAPDGEVTSIRVVQGSGSSVLDTAALAVFRNAHLPPFPPGTPAPPTEVEVSLHYVPAHKGG